MTLLQVINTLVIITTLSYLLETQWTFYKMKPSTINRIYQPLIQKPEVDEAEFNTRLSPSLDIDLKNMHLLENAEKLEATPKGDTMEGFYRKFLKSSLSLSSLKCDNTQPYTQEMSHLHRMHQQTQMENGEPQQQQEEDQECTKCSFFKFIWYSLKRSFFPKSPSTVSLDLSMLEDRFKDIEEDLIKVEQKTIEVKSRQKELYRYLRSEKGISDEECNFVIDQLVEEELEKLDSVEWKLNAIRRRLTKAARVLDKKVEHSIN